MTAYQVCRGYGDPFGYGYGVGMGIQIPSPRQPCGVSHDGVGPSSPKWCRSRLDPLYPPLLKSVKTATNGEEWFGPRVHGTELGDAMMDWSSVDGQKRRRLTRVASLLSRPPFSRHHTDRDWTFRHPRTSASHTLTGYSSLQLASLTAVMLMAVLYSRGQCRINANRRMWQLFARAPLLTRDKDLSQPAT